MAILCAVPRARPLQAGRFRSHPSRFVWGHPTYHALDAIGPAHGHWTARRRGNCSARLFPSGTGVQSCYATRRTARYAPSAPKAPFSTLSTPKLCDRAASARDPIQAEKFRPDRDAFGLATLANRAVASVGPMPGITSSRRLVSLERCRLGSGDRLEDLRLEPPQLGAKGSETRPRNLGY